MKIVAISALFAAAAYLLPTTVVDPLVRVLGIAIALMATGIFPCMTLVVNAMKGEQRTPAMVDKLYDGLRNILRILVVAFSLAVASILSLAATAALVAAKVPHLYVHIALASTAVAITFFAGRVIALGRSFFVVLDINRTQALLVARAKTRNEREEVIEAQRLATIFKDDPKPRALVKAQ